jgi:hypothetical protein
VTDLYSKNNAPSFAELQCSLSVSYRIRLIPFLRKNFLGEVGHQPSGEKVDNRRKEIPKSKKVRQCFRGRGSKTVISQLLADTRIEESDGLGNLNIVIKEKRT